MSYSKKAAIKSSYINTIFYITNQCHLFIYHYIWLFHIRSTGAKLCLAPVLLMWNNHQSSTIAILSLLCVILVACRFVYYSEIIIWWFTSPPKEIIISTTTSATRSFVVLIGNTILFHIIHQFIKVTFI